MELLPDWRSLFGPSDANRATSTNNNARVVPVHTAVPGRARLKVFGLKYSPWLKRRIEDVSITIPGIESACANVVTGNVLIHFATNASLDRLVERLHEKLEHDFPTANERNNPHPENYPDATRPSGAEASSKTGSNGDKTQGRTASEHMSQGLDQAWHTLRLESVLAAVGVSINRGLETAEAAERLDRYGPNALASTERRSLLGLFLGQFASPPVALLGVSAVVAIATGGLLDAAAILIVVLINASIGFMTEAQAERIIATLGSTAPPLVMALREGSTRHVPSQDVVPGDILLLSPGADVSADARLVDSEGLNVDESSLTGESMPVAKDSKAMLPEETPLAERRNMIYGGTLVTAGRGTAVVVATAERTEMGKIQALVSQSVSPDTPMERQLDRLGGQLALLSGAVCGVVFLVGLLRGQGLLVMLKSAVSLAVAAVPEGLPAVATTTLALGIRDMRRKKVLIRQLNAVETLGSTQVLCLDKTGTLTFNRMTVVAAHVGMQRISIEDTHFFIDGTSIAPHSHQHLERLLEVGVLCSEAGLREEDGALSIEGSPTEQALVELAIAGELDVLKLRQERPMLDMQQRSEERQYMATSHGSSGELPWVAVKGSPGQVLELCKWYLVDGEHQPLTESVREAILAENDDMAGRALRVLGLAYGVRDTNGNSGQEGLSWLGLVGMTDPLRPGIEWLLGRVHRAGIDTVIITGDQSATAYAIGRQLHLSQGETLEILDSTSLDKLDPEVLAGVVPRVHVFSRVSPTHKLQIVEAQQRAGRVVAMTGDGINDGPALKAADLGIAMGQSGTDVARSVADLVLEDDNLATLIVAVRQGRTVYGNIRKSLRFLLSTNFSEIELMLAGTALGLGTPLSPMQLLWINLITDIFPALALAMEPPEPDVLEHPPRDPEQPVIAAADLRRLAGESAVITGGAIASFGYAALRYGVGPQSRTHAFMTLTLAQLLHVLSCRSEEHSIYDKQVLPTNSYLQLALGGSLLAQLLTVFIPGLRQVLGTTPLGLLDGLVICGGAVGPLLVNEATKKSGRRARTRPSPEEDERRSTTGAIR